MVQNLHNPPAMWMPVCFKSQALVLGGLASAMVGGGAPEPCLHATYDFAQGDQGWTALFSDFSPEMTESMELAHGIRELPPELGRPGSGYLLQSTNRSDDVFMLLARRLGTSDGVTPGAEYIVHYTITMASDAPAGCSGAGGAPAESVFLKAGAAAHEPTVVVDPHDGLYHVTVDKGNQSEGGTEMAIAGNIANGGDASECASPRFRTFTRSYEHPRPVTASPDGDLWLLIGTDSGYEGRTRLYYERIEVELTSAAGS